MLCVLCHMSKKSVFPGKDLLPCSLKEGRQSSFKTGCVVSPGLKTRSVVDPGLKNGSLVSPKI